MSITDRFVRHEHWGQIVYDPQLDEFEAHCWGSLDDLRNDRPVSAGCLVTGRCNLHCGFCYGDREGLPKKELDCEDWRKVFGNLKSLGLMRADISGGEPTVRHDIGGVVAAALDSGLNVVLSTNGLLRAKKGLAEIPRSVRVHVSLDSGFAPVHERSRLTLSGRPSEASFQNTSDFISKCLDDGFRVRALTCIGPHNQEGLLELGEHLSLLGVPEWNISRVLPAGRAKNEYAKRWAVADEAILHQIHCMQDSFPWMVIRHSNRTSQDGYFLLVLPDGALATQYTDSRDKVLLGSAMTITLQELQTHPAFNIERHAHKWIARTVDYASPTWGALTVDASWAE